MLCYGCFLYVCVVVAVVFGFVRVFPFVCVTFVCVFLVCDVFLLFIDVVFCCFLLLLCSCVLCLFLVLLLFFLPF